VEVMADEIETVSVWPTYSVLCPLYKEANILPKFVRSMEALDYPKDRLECLLLLEEDDTETITAAQNANLPSYFKVLVLPNSKPKTKPKACNVGLDHARGEYVVIYDAEDLPEPDQLKKAVIAYSKVSSDVFCVQAKLNFYNPNQNILTKLFTTDYTLWYDLILPGFQAINAPIPLGGTSNHFKTESLRELGGWDPYNVTEDCDLGIRIRKEGYKTVLVDSITWEEANSNFFNWIRQRSRWIKGYFQTFFVNTRGSLGFIRRAGIVNYLIFWLVVGISPFLTLLNPFLWITTILYFAFRSTLGPVIESFYPAPVLYLAVFSFIFGNFLSLYSSLLASAKKDRDSFVKYGLLMPVYWFMISFAAWYGFIQLIFKPHYWEKTKHGLDLKEGSAPA